MLNAFLKLLGDGAPVFYRYVKYTTVYGFVGGLTIVTLVPIISHLLQNQFKDAFTWLAALFVGIIVSWLLRRKVETTGMYVAASTLSTARKRLGDHIATLPVGWFNHDNTARLSHVISQGIMEIGQLPAHLFTPVISGIIAPIVMAIALFFLNVKMGLIALITLPVIALVFLWSSKLGSKADESFHHASGLTSQRMIEFAQAQSVLRAFNGEGSSTRFLEQAIDEQKKSAQQLIYVSTASVVLNSWVVQMIFVALIFSAILGLNIILATNLNTAELISICVALILVTRFIDPLLDVAGYSESLRGAKSQLTAINEIFAVKPLPEAKNPLVPDSGSIEFKNVTFTYDEPSESVINDISFKIENGSMTALVGASGSGKSTLVNLISRFYDVNKGSVKIGDIDVREISYENLSKQISQIFQKTYLFEGSIADNIRVGKPNATESEVLEAAHLAGVDEIIQRLPDGFQTAVGEGGTKLSGGEKQRISIARALIKDAPILLVDEATAALDAENQAAVADTLSRLKGKRTVVVIAHQLSTISMADQIIVLEHGTVIEQGSHTSLTNKNGRYAHFLAQRNQAKGWRIA